jgi:hypothetical protein
MKRDDSRYALYQDAIKDGLVKLRKYYSRFDEKPSYIISLSKFSHFYSIPVLILSNKVLHPYFKLAYIKLAWGGAEEQATEHAAGNKHTKNWQDEARKVVE